MINHLDYFDMTVFSHGVLQGQLLDDQERYNQINLKVTHRLYEIRKADFYISISLSNKLGL